MGMQKEWEGLTGPVPVSQCCPVSGALEARLSRVARTAARVSRTTAEDLVGIPRQAIVPTVARARRAPTPPLSRSVLELGYWELPRARVGLRLRAPMEPLAAPDKAVVEGQASIPPGTVAEVPAEAAAAMAVPLETGEVARSLYLPWALWSLLKRRPL